MTKANLEAAAQADGVSAPRVIVLPGLDGSALLRQEFVRACAPFDTRVLDYPTHLGLGATYSSLLPWVKERLPATPFILVGESFSGPLACQVAAGQPEGLQGLMLVASFASSPYAALRPLASSLPHVPWPHPLSSRLVDPFLLGRWATPARSQALSEVLGRLSPDLVRQRLATALRTEVRGCLPDIKVPVCYLQASADRVVWPRSERAFRQVLPRMDTRWVEGPHALLQASPFACAREVQHFVTNLSFLDHPGAWTP